MADGTTPAIEDVSLGDLVVATDPETGEQFARQVTALIDGEGLKQLVEITIDTDGSLGEATATVTSTDGHPFWVDQTGQWVDAGDLRPGDQVLTDTGERVLVLTIRAWTVEDQQVYNLTIAGTHTYHVLAGSTPILAHNCENDSGVYAFRDSPTGLPYVGQSNNMNRRLGEHAQAGRRQRDDHVICIHVCGGQRDREAVEADIIELLGGKQNLANERNSPGLGRRNQ